MVFRNEVVSTVAVMRVGQILKIRTQDTFLVSQVETQEHAWSRLQTTDLCS